MRTNKDIFETIWVNSFLFLRFCCWLVECFKMAGLGLLVAQIVVHSQQIVIISGQLEEQNQKKKKYLQSSSFKWSSSICLNLYMCSWYIFPFFVLRTCFKIYFRNLKNQRNTVYAIYAKNLTWANKQKKNNKIGVQAVMVNDLDFILIQIKS